MSYCGVDGVWNGTACTTNTLYAKTDFKYIVVDGLGTAGASVVEWIDLIVLLVVLGFIIGIFVKMANLFK
jgi:hypothetical protein